MIGNSLAGLLFFSVLHYSVNKVRNGLVFELGFQLFLQKFSDIGFKVVVALITIERNV